ncbi:flagellin [Rhodovulum adriaticum]|uniref:Flagellar hook-associated protein 3 FlgL n=1 Tax=Rhodovulum adriaticum TaxID=35804 RepID=A0A4R2NZ97_RHOAD|nr:flagellin [Rhodovulum adriaticum]MBK1634786.1 hypothetical protein [Rhodovulum adriaticum]TCP27639.1 flagellar hook-associated protein 3 FlgL [Rhodovulum adriaticum]
MGVSSIGDLSRGLLLRQTQTKLKADLSRLSAELATGTRQDLRAHVQGDFRPLAAIDQRVSLLQARAQAGQETALVAEAMQTALGSLGTAVQDIAPDLLMAGDATRAVGTGTLAQQATGLLDQAVAALNAQAAGRALFAGARSDGPALTGADTMLAALRQEVDGLTDAASIRDRVFAWFDAPGGGFETQAYRGTTDPPGPVTATGPETPEIAINATDPALRQMLGGLALAALCADADLPDRDSVAAMAGVRLMGATTALSDLQADLGQIQTRMEQAMTANAAERGTLDLARSDITGADPYETATALQDSQARLETLYTITARLSRLSLAEYLS